MHVEVHIILFIVDEVEQKSRGILWPIFPTHFAVPSFVSVVSYEEYITECPPWSA